MVTAPHTDPAHESVTAEPNPGVSAAIILAAGAGTRMRSARSKLLHEIAGRSLLSYAVDAAAAAGAMRIVVVVGHQRDQVEEHLAEIAPHVQVVRQGADAYGTGYAVQCAVAELGPCPGEIMVTLADMPMVDGEILTALVAAHRGAGAAITVLTADVGDPTGYGRILRDPAGDVLGIVEHKEASEQQRLITEINSGVFVFTGSVLAAALAELTPSPTTGEIYLTDIPAIARRQRQPVRAHLSHDHWHAEGVNDRVQLQAMAAEMNRRTCRRWMLAGVTILDPASTWIHADVDLGTDVTLLPGTSLEGATSVASGATIGPDTTLIDVEVGAGASITRSHGLLAVIGAGATVGPFAYLRPGTRLGAGGKIGTFVETKNAVIGDGAKVPHLTYAGDTEIGEGANIGAGTIFANYDGVAKHRSSVGRFSFVGSDSVLIHPVRIGDGSYVAAGSAVTQDVEPGELAVARGRQRNVDGWVARRRAGTRTAQAAEAREADEADDATTEANQANQATEATGGTTSNAEDDRPTGGEVQ